MAREAQDQSNEALPGYDLATEEQEMNDTSSGGIDPTIEDIRQKVGTVDPAQLSKLHQKGAKTVQKLSDAERTRLNNLQEGDVIFLEDPEGSDPELSNVEWQVTGFEVKDLNDPGKDIIHFQETQEINGEFVDHPNPIRIPRSELLDYFENFKHIKIKALGATQEGAVKEIPQQELKSVDSQVIDTRDPGGKEQEQADAA